MISSSVGQIFIGGEGRSGTTLLSMIVNSHPEVFCGPELHFRGPISIGTEISRHAAVIDRAKSADIRKLAGGNLELLRGFQFVRRLQRFGFSLSEIQETYRGLEQSLPGTFGETFESRLNVVAHFAYLAAKRKGARFWGFKIMRDILISNRYRRSFPSARFLSIVRDGRDVLSSQMRDHGSWGYSSVQQGGESWSRTARYLLNQRGDHNHLVIRYEDLVEETLATTRRICEFLEVDWSAQMISPENFSPTSVSHNHPSRSALEGINSKSLRRFKSDLNVSETKEFEELAFRELQAWGYPLSFAPSRTLRGGLRRFKNAIWALRKCCL